MTLLELQRRMASAIMAPLGRGDSLTLDDSAANSIIKPNDRLNSAERLEIYAKSYWYRLLDSLYEDYPGLRAILGIRAFDRLARAYLAERPSESFTMRDLGSRLAEWIAGHEDFAGKNPALTLDMARLEWAHIVAFDGPAERVLGPEDMAEFDPEMIFHLQPYLSLLELSYPVDDLRIKVNDLPEGHAGASNAVLRRKERHAVRKFSLKPEEIYLAVHREDDVVYYRRVERDEFRLLRALGAGTSMGEAIDSIFDERTQEDPATGTHLQQWFAAWSENGWFCRPANAGEGKPR